MILTTSFPTNTTIPKREHRAPGLLILLAAISYVVAISARCHE